MILSEKKIILFCIPILLILSLIILAKSSLFFSSPSAISIGITLDLTLTIPLIYFFTIRKTKIPNNTIIPVFIFGMVIASQIIPIENQGLLDFIMQFIFPIVELFVISFIIIKVCKLRKAYNLNKNNLSFGKALKLAVNDFLPKRVATVFVTEISMIYYTFFSWKKLELNENDFSYHKNSGIIAVLTILLFMVSFETALFHLLLQMWSKTAAWILTGISLYTFLQITAIMRSLKKLPISINEDKIELQFGIFSETTIPFDIIDSIEVLSCRTNKPKFIEQLSPFINFTKPNILIKLKEKNTLVKLYGFTKKYKSIAFYLDEKDSFINMYLKNSIKSESI